MEYNWTMLAPQDDPVARPYEDRCHHIAAWLAVRRHQIFSDMIIYTPGEEELDEASTLPGAQTVHQEDQGHSLGGGVVQDPLNRDGGGVSFDESSRSVCVAVVS